METDKAKFSELLNRSSKPLAKGDGKDVKQTSDDYTDRRTRRGRREASA